MLEDMHIKKTLMDMLELPLALRHGILGRLEIQIPWSTLKKDPILVAVERVRRRGRERERREGSKLAYPCRTAVHILQARATVDRSEGAVMPTGAM